MTYTSITIDNFYNNPDEVRDYILTQDFNITGNFPGKRTEPILNESTTEYISKLI